MEPVDRQYPDLAFGTLDHDDAPDERVAGWIEGLRRGFHNPRPNDAFRSAWLEHCRADGVRIRGAWETEPRFASGTIPVATFASFDKFLNVSGADGRQLPLRMITDVTVSPAHRRRGLLRRLMTEDLADAVRRGIPLAALTVSEGSIYGRFGFGLGTQVRHVSVDTTSRFALREPTSTGHVELLMPAEAWPVVSSVFDRFHSTTRGSVARPHFYRTMLTGELDFQEQEPDTKLRAAIHVPDDGEPNGYVLYRIELRDGTRTLEVVDLVATDPTAYLRLWRFLADVDLVRRVSWKTAPMEDPLDWALADPHLSKVEHVEDLLWVRVLDVPAALSVRPWGADDVVVLEVEDPLGHAGGRWLVRTEGGSASIDRTDAGPDVRMTADTLGALYLGGMRTTTLADAGRIRGEAAALGRFAAMAEAGPAPYCITGF